MIELTFSFNFEQKKGVTDEILLLEITDIARGGSGVARDPGGRVIFVPKTAPGDQVRVRVISAEKKYAQAELLEIIRPSPLRQEPRCPVFGTCGGCSWQHIPYEQQWKTKASGVRHALSRVQIQLPAEFPVDEYPAERIWEYRNRIQLRGEGAVLGFHAAGTRRIVPITRCEIARPEINEALNEARVEGAKLRKPYKVEIATAGEGRVQKVWNARHGAAGFRQIHDEQNEKLRQWVARQVFPGSVVFDLYGGSGNLSLGLADRMIEVHCVDISSPAGAETPRNFKFYRSDTLRWISKAREWSPLFPEQARAAGRLAILDPPREGLADGFSAIEEGLSFLGVRSIIAVGCDPDAWARDVCRFARRSWVLKRVAFFDFFPHTPHIESVALLVRDDLKGL